MTQSREKSLTTYACWLLSAGLLVFYILTLYQGSHPNVSPSYREFYLEKEITAWPGLDGLKIQPGQLLSFTSEEETEGQGAIHLVSEGRSLTAWQFIDSEGYAITSWQAGMIFYGEPGQSYRGTVVATAPAPEGELTISVNGEQVSVSSFGERTKTISFETPSLPEDGRLYLEFFLGETLETPLFIESVVFE